MQLETRNLKLVIFCDGGSRGNPGPSAAAFVAVNEEEQVIHQHGAYLGTTTNNVAEYQAVILALEWILNQLKTKNPVLSETRPELVEGVEGLKLKAIDIILDSQLLHRQINGEYRVKADHLKPLYQQIKQLERELKSSLINLSFCHQLRHHNTLADTLVNQTLDLHS